RPCDDAGDGQAEEEAGLGQVSEACILGRRRDKLVPEPPLAQGKDQAMPTITNPARERLQRGELAIGIGLRQARTAEIAPAMKTCGFDWLFIDLEHGSMGLDTAVQISIAALSAGISPIVRVPKGRYDLATRALDGGAYGIVMPHVDTAEEA